MKLPKRGRPDSAVKWRPISSKATRYIAAATVSALLLGTLSAVAVSYGGGGAKAPEPVVSINKAVAAGLAVVPFQQADKPAAAEVPAAPAIAPPVRASRPDAGSPASGRPGTPVAGSSAPFTITCKSTFGDNNHECRVASTGGFAGVIIFSCADLPDQLGCEFDPPSVSLRPGSQALTKLTISIGPRLRRGLTTFYAVASHGGLQSRHSITWNVGSLADPRGVYGMQCGKTITILPGERGEMACTVESHSGFKGPVSLNCVAFGGLICTESATTVVLEEYQDVPVKFYIEVPAGTPPGWYVPHIFHNGDMANKSPFPFTFNVDVSDPSPPAPLPPCPTALPALDCYMDPSKLLPTHP